MTRFHHEARAAAQIRGEHSVRLIDFGTLAHSGEPFLVMELLSGRDLAAVLSEGSVSLADAALYILQACEGMAEVHAHGIVHRDLKPGNLFLTRRVDGDPLIKVLDFGIAKGVAAHDAQVGVLTQTLVSLGTPLYMSPEQVRSSRNVDARADVWSLGVIFYELVSGRPAFGGNTVTHITAQVLEGTPFALSSLVAGLPPTVDGVVQKALAKNPDERFVDVAALASALEPFAGPSGVGYADRAARILRGALRPDAALIFTAEDSKPAARDDALGGTRRFDRTARLKRARVAVGFLALLAVVLVWSALDAYRGSARAAPARAEAHLARAFRMMLGFARLSAERTRLKPSTAALSEATAISDLAPASHATGLVASGLPPTIPSSKVSPPPTISGPLKPAPGLGGPASPASPSSPGPPSNGGPPQPFNPYAERN